jgi:hypothetical protein
MVSITYRHRVCLPQRCLLQLFTSLSWIGANARYVSSLEPSLPGPSNVFSSWLQPSSPTTALCPTSQLLVVNIVQGLLQRRLLRWLRLDHYNYVDVVAIALLAFRRSSLPLTHPKHERVPPELLSARPINPGSAVCMKQRRHGGRAQRGRVSFWTRVREESTTTAS